MKDNFKYIYKILSFFEKTLDVEEPDVSCISYHKLEISKTRWNAYMEMLYDCGYLKSVYIENTMEGLDVDISNARITLKGLEYLSENTIMQKMYKTAKGIMDLVP